MHAWHLGLTAFVLGPASLLAQIGGNGSNGPFTPTANVALDTTANGGVFQFTTIQIPAGVTVTVRGPNTAVLLCQGSVDIQGVLEADATGILGAGGWWGGGGGPIPSPGQGPGGGPEAFGIFVSEGGAAAHATPGIGWGSVNVYGDDFPFDLRGGSGGGGAYQWSASYSAQNGASGGGAIAVFADGPTTITGLASARGGDAVWTTGPFSSPPWQVPGGAGSGGSILVRSLESVRVTGQVLTSGGMKSNPWYGSTKTGGDGSIRIDAYGSPPDVTGATIQPAPLLVELPYLQELAPPKLGQVWQPRCASVPGDVLGWWMSMRTLPSPIALPFGTLYLDYNPGGGFVFAGALTVPSSGIDPLAGSDFMVPNSPALVGVTFYSQMFNVLGAVTGRPRLSNLLSSTVQ